MLPGGLPAPNADVSQSVFMVYLDPFYSQLLQIVFTSEYENHQACESITIRKLIFDDGVYFREVWERLANRKRETIFRRCVEAMDCKELGAGEHGLSPRQ